MASAVTDLLNDGLQSHLAGDLPRAVEVYTEVLSKDSQNATAYNWRGSAYDDLGEHQKALDDLTKAVEIDNKYADAFNNRGEVFRKIGKPVEALRDYLAAAKLDPSFAEAHYNMALVYEAQNKKAQAAQEYKNYANLKPDAKDKEQVLALAKTLETAPGGQPAQPAPRAPGKPGQPGQMARPTPGQPAQPARPAPPPGRPGQPEVAQGSMTAPTPGQPAQQPSAARPGASRPGARPVGPPGQPAQARPGVPSATAAAASPSVPPPFDQIPGMDAATYKELKPWIEMGQEWAPVVGIAMVVLYVLHSLFLFLIARKTGTGPAILAFLPILDTYLQYRIAEKPIWWFLISILLAPIGLVMYLIVCFGMANARGKSGIWGLLVFLPFTRTLALAYLGLSR